MEIIASPAGVLTDSVAQLIDDLRVKNPSTVDRIYVQTVPDKLLQRQVILIGHAINLDHLVTSCTPGVKVIGLSVHRSGANAPATLLLELTG